MSHHYVHVTLYVMTVHCEQWHSFILHDDDVTTPDYIMMMSYNKLNYDVTCRTAIILHHMTKAY